MFIYLSITKYASHLDLDPYKIMSSKQMSRSMSKSTFTYLFMILKSIIKNASHLDQFKMMSSNVAKWCHQMLHCCIATTVVLEPAICEDLDLHVAILLLSAVNTKVSADPADVTMFHSNNSQTSLCERQKAFTQHLHSVHKEFQQF